jgi:hypothetical protein
MAILPPVIPQRLSAPDADEYFALLTIYFIND